MFLENENLIYYDKPCYYSTSKNITLNARWEKIEDNNVEESTKTIETKIKEIKPSLPKKEVSDVLVQAFAVYPWLNAVVVTHVEEIKDIGQITAVKSVKNQDIMFWG